jgi:2-oxoglutarate dehydrogenase E2 component (dihydrolipoamide succinyltransferase)
MILEMKVPSPGESITEVEIAQWLVKDGDYVEKDQPIAEVDSDKVVSLKANEGDTVAVGEIVCLINTEETGPKSENSTETIIEKIEPKINKKTEIISDDKNYASGSSSPAAKKILDEKGISSNEIVGTGRNGRITKQDAVNAKASMG